MEDMVAQRREDPAFSMKHTLFDESLVAGAPNARREALGAVMVEQIGVGLVQDRLVARRLRHRRLDVVGHHELRRPAHVLEAAHVRGAPVLDLLGRCRLGVEPARHRTLAPGLAYRRLCRSCGDGGLAGEDTGSGFKFGSRFDDMPRGARGLGVNGQG